MMAWKVYDCVFCPEFGFLPRLGTNIRSRLEAPLSTVTRAMKILEM